MNSFICFFIHPKTISDVQLLLENPLKSRGNRCPVTGDCVPRHGSFKTRMVVHLASQLWESEKKNQITSWCYDEPFGLCWLRAAVCFLDLAWRTSWFINHLSVLKCGNWQLAHLLIACYFADIVSLLLFHVFRMFSY